MKTKNNSAMIKSMSNAIRESAKVFIDYAEYCFNNKRLSQNEMCKLLERACTLYDMAEEINKEQGK